MTTGNAFGKEAACSVGDFDELHYHTVPELPTTPRLLASRQGCRSTDPSQPIPLDIP